MRVIIKDASPAMIGGETVTGPLDVEATVLTLGGVNYYSGVVVVEAGIPRTVCAIDPVHAMFLPYAAFVAIAMGVAFATLIRR